MRRVMHGDVVAAARALRALAPQDRPRAIARMIMEAEAADRYRKRFGRAHPLFGTGALMSAAARHPRPPEPDLGDVDYLDCLHAVFAALIDRGAGRKISGLRHDNVSCHAYLCLNAAQGGSGHGGEETASGAG